MKTSLYRTISYIIYKDLKKIKIETTKKLSTTHQIGQSKTDLQHQDG